MCLEITHFPRNLQPEFTIQDIVYWILDKIGKNSIIEIDEVQCLKYHKWQAHFHFLFNHVC